MAEGGARNAAPAAPPRPPHGPPLGAGATAGLWDEETLRRVSAWQVRPPPVWSAHARAHGARPLPAPSRGPLCLRRASPGSWHVGLPCPARVQLSVCRWPRCTPRCTPRPAARCPLAPLRFCGATASERGLRTSTVPRRGVHGGRRTRGPRARRGASPHADTPSTQRAGFHGRTPGEGGKHAVRGIVRYLRRK